MVNTAPEGLIEHFSKLEDPRVDRTKKHELTRQLHNFPVRTSVCPAEHEVLEP